MGAVDQTTRTLQWTQPHMMRSEFELADGGSVVGVLRFRSAYGSLATGEYAGGYWTFKRQGFLQTRVSIRRCGSDEDIAVFLNNCWANGGTLRLPDGTEYRASTNFWQTRYGFVDAAERPIVSYRMRQLLRLSGDMEIHADGAARPELPWMALLGWYLAVMMQRDSVVATA